MSTVDASSRPVTAGLDGSPESFEALDLAADEAARRGRPVRIVTVLHWPVLAVPAAPETGWSVDDRLVTTARALLREGAQRATARHPALPVTTDMAVGSPAGVLIAESRTAELVAVGHRGTGGFAGLLAGSVATQLTAHAACPVLVARPTTSADGTEAPRRVLVGIDGEGQSTAAVAFAFEEAASRGVLLHAIHVWSVPSLPDRHMFQAVADDRGIARHTAERTLAEALAGYSEKYPEVDVHRELFWDPDPAAALVRHSSGAGLVVVGSRRRGVLSGMLLGSVGQALVHHSDCPVAVVHRNASPA